MFFRIIILSSQAFVFGIIIAVLPLNSYAASLGGNYVSYCFYDRQSLNGRGIGSTYLDCNKPRVAANAYCAKTHQGKAVHWKTKRINKLARVAVYSKKSGNWFLKYSKSPYATINWNPVPYVFKEVICE